MSDSIDLALVKDLAVVANLLAGSRRYSVLSRGLMREVTALVDMLVEFNIARPIEYPYRSRLRSLCNRCMGTGAWQERGMVRPHVSWLKCPRCEGSGSSSIGNTFWCVEVAGDDGPIVIPDLSRCDWPKEVVSGNCAMLSELAIEQIGASLESVARFMLHRETKRQSPSKHLMSASYILDLSPFVVRACDCGVVDHLRLLPAHVPVLVASCGCAHAGARDTRSNGLPSCVQGVADLPECLHGWLWIEHAIRHPYFTTMRPAQLGHLSAACKSELARLAEERNLRLCC